MTSKEIDAAEANLVGFISLLVEADKNAHRQNMKATKLEEDIKFLLS